MGVKFQQELLKDIWDEMLPLFLENFNEVEAYKNLGFDPDKDGYMAVEELGRIRAFTIRQDSGELCGYLVFFVNAHMHNKNILQAYQDVLFISPKYRGHGYRFLRWCDEMLRQSGVDFVLHEVTVSKDFRPLLEKIGYEHRGYIYTRKL